jgi:hypothetical protein
MKGIIENRSIWFTDIDSVNDPFELHYGKEIITNILNGYIEKQKDENIVTMLRGIYDYLIASTNKIIHRPYIACFCENGNLLSQWRGYSGENGGYSLCFRIQDTTNYLLDASVLNKSEIVFLRKIIYNKEIQETLIKNYIDKIIIGAKNLFLNINGNVKVVWVGMASLSSANIFLDMMLSFKNPCFQEEKEWRIIKIVGSGKSQFTNYLQFNEKKGQLLPFLNIYLSNNESQIPTFPLKSIMHSPLLDSKTTCNFLTQYLQTIRIKSYSIALDKEIEILSPGYYLKS